MLIKNLNNVKIIAFGKRAPEDISFLWFNQDNEKKYYYNKTNKGWEEVGLSQDGIYLPFLTSKNNIVGGNALFIPLQNTEGDSTGDQKVSLLSIVGGEASIPAFLQEEYFTLERLEDGRYLIRSKDATETQGGIVSRATFKEATEGENNIKFITPFQLRNVLGKFLVPFFETDTPSIINYSELYAQRLGQFPSVKIYFIDKDYNRAEGTERPYFVLSNGGIVSINFGQLDTPSTGFILLSH